MKAFDLFLLVVAIIAGLVSIFWDYVPLSLLHKARLNDVGCPLGFTSEDADAMPGLNYHQQFTLYYNGTVMTNDEENPYASSFVVQNGLFISAFKDGDSLPPVLLQNAEKKNLKGCLVTPGMVDPHVHLLSGGLVVRGLNLRGMDTDGLRAMVKNAVESAERDTWILGYQFDGEFGSQETINDISENNPVVIYKFDAHQVLVNKNAFHVANVSAATKDPEGGSIERDATGQPTGVLSDNAISLITSHVPSKDVTTLKEALLTAQQYAFSKGVTAVGDMGRVAFQEGDEASWTDLQEILMPAARSNELKLRVNAFVSLKMWRQMVEMVHVFGTTKENRLTFGNVKEFYDGSLSSRTALMYDPYNDDPTTSGLVAVNVTEFQSLVEQAHAHGLTVGVHAIGSKAVDDVIQVYKKVATETVSSGKKIIRHRIEHAQHIPGPETIQTMALYEIPITPNPSHLPGDKEIIHKRLGKRTKTMSYPFREFVSSNVRMGLASDWPVVELDPWTTLLDAADTSHDKFIAFEEALHGVTRGASIVNDPNANFGDIRPGMEADFVIHSSDPSCISTISSDDTARKTKRLSFKNGTPKHKFLSNIICRDGVKETYIAGECVFGC